MFRTGPACFIGPCTGAHGATSHWMCTPGRSRQGAVLPRRSKRRVRVALLASRPRSFPY